MRHQKPIATYFVFVNCVQLRYVSITHVLLLSPLQLQTWNANTWSALLQRSQGKNDNFKLVKKIIIYYSLAFQYSIFFFSFHFFLSSAFARLNWRCLAGSFVFFFTFHPAFHHCPLHNAKQLNLLLSMWIQQTSIQKALHHSGNVTNESSIFETDEVLLSLNHLIDECKFSKAHEEESNEFNGNLLKLKFISTVRFRVHLQTKTTNC